MIVHVLLTSNHKDKYNDVHYNVAAVFKNMPSYADISKINDDPFCVIETMQLIENEE